MKIEKIQLNNFRGFKGEHSITFNPNLNVFVGKNGAGKSSILDAVGMLLSAFLMQIDFTELKKKFTRTDINYEADESVVGLAIHSFFNHSNHIQENVFENIYMELEYYKEYD